MFDLFAMKPFGVVGCTGCRKAFGVELRCKTSRCPWCGKQTVLSKVKVLAATGSQKELCVLVGKINLLLEEKK